MNPLDEILNVCPDAIPDKFNKLVLCGQRYNPVTHACSLKGIYCTEKCRNEKLRAAFENLTTNDNRLTTNNAEVKNES